MQLCIYFNYQKRTSSKIDLEFYSLMNQSIFDWKYYQSIIISLTGEWADKIY
jgi:hypothetical protein